MKKLTLLIFSVFVISLLHFSCSEDAKTKNEPNTNTSILTFGKSVKTNIGTTGFTIDLPESHKIEEKTGSDFNVYYITSFDTTYNKGEAGIYFGPEPDEHGPANIASKEESTGMQLGKQSKTVKYTTEKYTWVETVIDESEGKKIQTWYFAFNISEMEKLRQMMNTISRK
ncbi:hypothetical protein BH11BAC7_BH11BAC7_26670 [soil metagenome]